MKKIILLVFVTLLLTACKAEYTITYKDGKFTEEMEIDTVSLDADEFSDFLETETAISDDFVHEKKDNKQYFKYEVGEDLKNLRMFYACFENIYVLDEDDFVSLITDGDNLCSSDEVKIVFKTDKVVLSSNAKKIDDNTYQWNSLDKGINIQVSKTKEVKKANNFKKETNIRIIFVAVILVILIPTIFILKRKNKEI